jgi:hypothetical protein
MFTVNLRDNPMIRENTMLIRGIKKFNAICFSASFLAILLGADLISHNFCFAQTESENLLVIPSIEISHIRGDNVQNRSYIEFDEAMTKDVSVKVWAMPENSEVWVTIKPKNSDTLFVYGPGRKETTGLWMIYDVRFGEGYYQNGSYSLRAVIIDDRGPFANGINLSANEFFQCSSVKAVSEPIDVNISNRTIEPDSECKISISTIDKKTVDPLNDYVVSTIVNVTGMISLPESSCKPIKIDADSQLTEPTEKEQHEEIKLAYVIVRPQNDGKCGIFGPAEMTGEKWVVRNIQIPYPVEPKLSGFEIFSVISTTPIKVGYVFEYDDWFRNYQSEIVAISEHIEVFPKAPQYISGDSPEISITHLRTFNGSEVVTADTDVRVLGIENILEVRGVVDRLREGSSVWCILGYKGTDKVTSYGPALMENDSSWVLPVTLSKIPGYETDSLYLQAVISTKTFPPIIDYKIWRGVVESKSSMISIFHDVKEDSEEDFVYGERNGKRFEESSLTITKIGSKKVSAGSWENVPVNADVEGEFDCPLKENGLQIWIGKHEIGNIVDEWSYDGPAIIYDGKWRIPDVSFRQVNNYDELKDDERKSYEVLAFVTVGDLRESKGVYPELANNALIISEVYHVIDEFQDWRKMMDTSLINGLIILGMILLFHVLFGIPSKIVKSLLNEVEKIDEGFTKIFKGGHVPGNPGPEAVNNPSLLNRDSFIGVLLFAVWVLIILIYQPAYKDILTAGFSLNPDVGNRIAWYVLIYLGIAGLVPDYLVNMFSEIKNIYGKAAISFLVFCIVGSLLLLFFFQFNLYDEYYRNAPTNLRTAFAGAAVLFAFAEALIVFCATRLKGIDLFLLIIVKAPLFIMTMVLKILKEIFNAIPSFKNRTKSSE